ncbi:MAG TPA: GTPase Era, partial [bacterium]|nr:GTPase Era [bacterium]
MGFKSGFVCIAGLPNAGKSTLINRVLESKLLAVSDKPQTTRNNILGIFTSKDAQIIFIDTPGYHNIQKEINKFYVNEAVSASNKADLVVYLFDAKESLSKRLVLNDEFITEILKKKDREKILPVVSKVDLLRPEQFLKLKKRLSEQYGFNEDKILGVSVPKSVGVAELLLKIKETLPEGPMYYSEDDLTDRNLRFLCAELI